MQPVLHEVIVDELRVCGEHPIDLFELSRREILSRIETPATFQNTLPPENLVKPCDTACKSVPDVEQGGIGVGERGRFG